MHVIVLGCLILMAYVLKLDPSKPKAPYVCSRCSRDKNEMKDLTQIEEMLIVCAL